jgi:hypothetical protein
LPSLKSRPNHEVILRGACGNIFVFLSGVIMKQTKTIGFTASISILMIGTLCYVLPASAGTLYKCKTESGKFVYKDKPCLGNDAQISKKEFKNDVLSGRQSAAEVFVSEQQLKTVLASAISELQVVKIAIVEHLFSNGSWPTSLASLGFNATNMKSSNIEQVKIGANGKVSALLSPQIGSNAILALTPRLVMDQTSVEWETTTNIPDSPSNTAIAQPSNTIN